MNKNPNKKIVFFDVDGTIFDFRHQVVSSTKNAIKRLHDNGVYTAICSGRARSRIYDDLFLDFGIKGVVAGCGTYVEWEKEVLLNYIVPPELSMKAVDILRKHGMVPTMGGPVYTYFDENEYVEGIDHYRQIVIDRLGDKRLEITGHEQELVYNKFSAKRVEGSDVEGACREMAPWFYAIRHSDATVEYVPNGYTKASGIEFLLQYLEIDPEDVYAFGDGSNDMEMFAFARHTAAMGNGRKTLQEKAEYVTSPHYEGGIEEGLKYFGLL